MSKNLKQFDQTILLQYIRSESCYDGKENELLGRVADYVEDVKDEALRKSAIQIIDLWKECIEEAGKGYPKGRKITKESLMTYVLHIFNERTQLLIKKLQ